MGCGMSRSNLMDDFGSRLFHHKPHTTPPKLLMNTSSQPPIVHHPPVLQKITTTREVQDYGRSISNSKGDTMWFGSPSFREYVIQSSPHVATTGDDEGARGVVHKHGGENLACNGQVCVWEDSKGKVETDRHDIRGGRFRKVFQVHRVAFWHGGAWHPGHPKATRKAT